MPSAGIARILWRHLGTRSRLVLGLAGAGALAYGSVGILPAGWLPSWLSDSRVCALEKVVDGDSLWVRCSGNRVRVRMHCIDAPELAQGSWGRASREHLASLIAPRAPVELAVIDTDRYGRTVADVYSADDQRRLLNLEQVRQGQAAVYHQYCEDGRYGRAEREARKAKRGIWRKSGDHQTPWRFRHGAK